MKDFSKFNPDKATKYKKWLRNSKNKGKTIQLCTYNNYLRSLKKFFSWLSLQPGYKSKIIATEICYLKISDSDERIGGQTEGKRYPDIEYVLGLTESIVINNEVDMRDRALISFAALTGIRDTALATLPIGCIDITMSYPAFRE
jgi:integrase/recombinase XerD